MTPEILSESSRNSVRLLPRTLPDYPAKILLYSLPKSGTLSPSQPDTPGNPETPQKNGQRPAWNPFNSCLYLLPLYPPCGIPSVVDESLPQPLTRSLSPSPSARPFPSQAPQPPSSSAPPCVVQALEGQSLFKGCLF